MILVFGGTTEGRLAVRTLDESGNPYFYSTKSDLQDIKCKFGTRLSGALDRESMPEFCRDKNIRLIIDAAHPFASQLHDTIRETSERLEIPVIRFERTYPPDDYYAIYCNDYDDAITKLNAHCINRLLALTGVQTIAKLKPFWTNHECRFRILDRDESYMKAVSQGFPPQNLFPYNEDSDCVEIVRQFHPEAIITKESGKSGGFEEKLQVAKDFGLKFFVVRRPTMPPNFITVYGVDGLRQQIEHLYPEFYPLHTGFTTGACATVAAKAAALALFKGEICRRIPFTLPSGEVLEMDVESVTVDSGGNAATAVVVKDAGDDPDVTNGCHVVVNLKRANREGIKFIGGEGIGTVTLPGIGIEVGEPAINPVPRKMIENELTAIFNGGIDVTISIPEGKELALKTFNPRIGIVGGISIIGTTGIVRPFSHEAFVDSMRREIEVAKAMGCRHIVVNSGGKSERYVKALYPDLLSQAFIHYGNAIGDIMNLAQELAIENLTIGLMIGKAVKLAEGKMDTHSHKSMLNREFLCDIANECGCGDDVGRRIAEINMSRELWGIIPQSCAERFFTRILELCHANCKRIYRSGQLESLLITDEGEIPYRIK
ncbi:MAG: cobalt-precorrin-5B (C(1))-methyltransferase CbiD [Bacteroides sp.]|nr:cobalt-precorrin-5B (C(1))-methyltransferase CbiD [Bacteroides sp.]